MTGGICSIAVVGHGVELGLCGSKGGKGGQSSISLTEWLCDEKKGVRRLVGGKNDTRELKVGNSTIQIRSFNDRTTASKFGPVANLWHYEKDYSYFVG